MESHTWFAMFTIFGLTSCPCGCSQELQHELLAVHRALPVGGFATRMCFDGFYVCLKRRSSGILKPFCFWSGGISLRRKFNGQRTPALHALCAARFACYAQTAQVLTKHAERNMKTDGTMASVGRSVQCRYSSASRHRVREASSVASSRYAVDYMSALEISKPASFIYARTSNCKSEG